MKQATKRLFSLILGFLFVIAAFVIYFEFIQPASDEVQKIKSELYSRELFLETQSTAIEQVERLIASYKGEGRLQDFISLALPFSPDYASVLAHLSGLMKNNGLRPLSLGITAPGLKNLAALQKSKAKSQGSASSTALVKPIATLRVQAAMKGNYENLKRFLSNLENNIRIFEVETLALTPGKTSDDFNFTMNLVTYYQNF